MKRFPIIVIVLAGLVLFSGCTKQGDAPKSVPAAQIPAEYQQLYSNLNASLNSYDAYLSSHSTGEKYPVIFGAELLPANANRVSDLLEPKAMQGVTVYLDRLQELGVQGATVSINYPVYTAGFPRYQEYVQFYKQVGSEVRKRGMKLSVETGVIFSNTEFSTSKISFAGLTFEKYKVEKKAMIAAIINDLQPDYLNLGAEPDTEYGLTGMKELNSPEKYTELINYILSDLNRGSTKIGAGIGTWGNVEYVKKFAANTTLDFIDIHVYPVFGKCLENIVTISDIAREHNKKVVLDECWLYKASSPEAGSVAANAEIFKRDTYSFWAPLDQRFLAAMVKSARLKNIEYISPFWTNYFFAYADYSASTAKLSYTELTALVNSEASKNIVEGKYTTTGEYYRKLISENK